MLQQTTVATVIPYFHKFLRRWPTLNDLAKASLDDVLREWAGLGYYRRARMLVQCAAVVQRDYGGVFPADEPALLALPGFGAYTAAAVRAIAFDKPANVVDGNVERVMARIFAVTEPLPQAKKALRDLAAQLVPQKRCGDYAQALMDLGATVCAPRSPKCDLCPWQAQCQAFAQGIQETLPRRVKSAPKPVRRAVAFVAQNGQGAVFLRRRPSQGLLADMTEVPSSPWIEGVMPDAATALEHAPVAAQWRFLPGTVTHVFTHFHFEISVAVAKLSPRKAAAMRGQWVAPDRLGAEALPSVMRKIVAFALKE